MPRKTLKERGLLKKKLPAVLQSIAEEHKQQRKAGKETLNVYFLDESRFGLMPRLRRVLCPRGVKPLLPYQHRFANFYLFGAFSPLSGEHFVLELPDCNTRCFQLFLHHFSQQSPGELKIIILDNGAFHHSRTLVKPNNVELLFLPPYSPELNGAEKVWRHLKDALGNRLFSSLEDLSDHLCNIIQETLTPQTLRSLTSFDYLTQAAMPFFDG